VTVSLDGTVTVKACDPPITKLGKVVGENTGTLANFADAVAIVTAFEASEKSLSPTILVALTLTVYVPAATLVKS
jgi:hypothetical protein